MRTPHSDALVVFMEGHTPSVVLCMASMHGLLVYRPLFHDKGRPSSMAGLTGLGECWPVFAVTAKHRQRALHLPEWPASAAWVKRLVGRPKAGFSGDGPPPSRASQVSGSAGRSSQ
jgi:hypothetical protein